MKNTGPNRSEAKKSAPAPQKKEKEALDDVEEASIESFPASDPPSSHHSEDAESDEKARKQK